MMTDLKERTSHGEASDTDKLRGLESRLKALISQPQLLAAGRVFMINLDVVRDRLGAEWPALRERVHSAAERIIGRHLANSDVFFRSSDDEYILVFAVGDKVAAKLVCGKIAEEIHRLFLGDTNLLDVRIGAAVGIFEGKVVFKDATIAEILRHMDEASPRSVMEAIATEDRALYSHQDLIKHLYRPIWDVRRQAISTYMCVPVREYPDGSSIEGVSALDGFSDPQSIAAIDMKALISSVDLLDELFRNKFRMMLSIPVCFETVASRFHREEYLEICRTIPDRLRRFVAFELLRFPAGVPIGRMTELVNEMKPFGSWTFLRTDLQAKVAGFAGSGLTGVTVQLPSDRAEEAHSMTALDSIVASAERARMIICVLGVSRTSQAVAARGAGAAFIAGDLIGQADNFPQHMLRFTWQDVYRTTGK